MNDAHVTSPAFGPRELFLAVSQGANGAELGIAIAGLEGALPLLYVNQALNALAGAVATEGSEASLWKLIAPEERPRVIHVFDALTAGEPAPRTLETTIVDSEGKRIAAEMSLTRIQFGELPAVVCFVTDLSDKKRAEEELRSSEARFRRLVGSAPDGVLILHRTHILFANASAANLFDVNEPELLVGQELETFLEPHHARISTPLVSLMEGRAKTLEPFEVVTRRGRVAEISAIALEYQGQPAVLGFARDVTERKAIQARLVQADRLAAVGMLAAGVAHEVNNPLAYVLLNLKYLERELPKLAADPSRLESLLKHVADANHGAERVQTIVRDLRTFARADEEPAGPVDLVHVVESALTMAEHEVRQCAQLRRVYFGHFSVNGTPAKLEQVFLNVIVNAAQAIGKASPEAHVLEIRLEPSTHGLVRAIVSDTGPGISPKILDRAFEPFFTTKPPGVGTGLGLPICKSIIESFGGSIRVESALGQGTKVYIELREHPDEPPAASSRRSQISEIPPSRRARLLIVDDEPSVASMLARFLESAYEVVTATSGSEALELLTQQEFEVVLCDIMMPTMTGMEFYNRLQADMPAMRDRLVFMTGGALLPEVAAFLSRVERPKIEKPFDLQELRRVLGRFTRMPNSVR